MTGQLSQEVKKRRMEAEEKLRGLDDKLIPPSYLTDNQIEIFQYIVEELKASKILGNLDIFILVTCVIAIDRVQQIERQINEDSNFLLNKQLLVSKDKYTRDFFRCLNELSLSPQSRAKLGNINLLEKEKAEDPVLKVLRSR